MRARRTLTSPWTWRGAACILVGLACTIGIAWICVLWSDDRLGDEVGGAKATATDRDWLCRHGWAPRGPVSQRVGYQLMFTDLRALGLERRAYSECPVPLAPGRPGEGLGMVQDVSLGYRLRAGWPFLSLEAGRHELYEGDEPAWFSSGIPVHVNVDVGGPIAVLRPLPLRPILPGFLINWLTWSIAAFAILAGPRLMVGLCRARRGRCRCCGYQLRGASGMCPECGARRSVQQLRDAREIEDAHGPAIPPREQRQASELVE